MGYGFRLIFLKPCRTFLSVASWYKSQILMFLMLFPLIKEEGWNLTRQVGGVYTRLVLLVWDIIGLRKSTFWICKSVWICACLQFLPTTSLIFPSFEAVFGLLDHVFDGFTGGEENGSWKILVSGINSNRLPAWLASLSIWYMKRENSL